MTSAAVGPATVGRDPFMPGRPPGMRSSLALALLAHALLIAGLAYSVDWHAATPEAVEAELWSALPQQAAPRTTAPEPAPPAPAPAPRVTPAPAPVPRPQPASPPAPPRPDPQIALEKAREARRIEAQEAQAEQAQARREKARRDELAARDQQQQQQAEKKLAADRQQAAEQQKVDKQQLDKQQLDKQRADKQKVEREQADKTAAAQQAKARADYLKRMEGLAGASGDEKSTGTAAKSSGPSAGYAGRIKARIKPNINFADTVDGNPTATVEVKVAPDGTITARRLVQSSGAKAWDDAVLRAIDRTDGLPRDIDGRVPPVMLIDFKPRDL